jgi:hypothetical protein
MTKRKRYWLVVAVALGLSGCNAVTSTEIQPDATATPASQTTTPTSLAAPTATNVDYQTAFGIDYSDPKQYLEQGEQSQISDPTVLDSLHTPEQSIAHLGKVYRWLHDEFTAESNRGRSIGAVTVDQLLVERQLGGCHDYALVYAAVVRHLGYPALMADSYSIVWIQQFHTWRVRGCLSIPPTVGTWNTATIRRTQSSR